MGEGERGLQLRTRLVVFGSTIGLYATMLGVDGGAGFQVVAVEELGLSPAAIGTALGLGVVSIPVQLWAARIPLARARANLRIFLVLVAAGALVMAGLVAFVDPGTPLAVVALAVTVLAEIAVSVLFATSWQPLLQGNLSSTDRQWVNARGRAANGVLVIVVLVVFGRLGSTGRVVILVGVAAIALGMAWFLRAVPVPTASPRTRRADARRSRASAQPTKRGRTRSEAMDGSRASAQPTRRERTRSEAMDGSRASRPRTKRGRTRSEAMDGSRAFTLRGARERTRSGGGEAGVRRLLVLAGFGAASSWPLFPVYLATVAWPGVNLGLVGAIEAAFAIAVALLWRPTDGDLVPRARAGAVVLVAAAAVLVALPLSTGGAGDVVDVAALAAYGAAVAARAVLLTAMLELLHRTLVADTSVRVLTVLDVVASTSVQAALFVGGLLVGLSTTVAVGPTNPYELLVLALAAGASVALSRLASGPT